MVQSSIEQELELLRQKKLTHVQKDKLKDGERRVRGRSCTHVVVTVNRADKL